ncbi:MAG: hypothetical protein ACR2NI_13055, partial [Pirellulales bacterium]
MESASSPTDDSEQTALELLEQLRFHPQLLKAVYNSSPAERVNQKKLRKEFPAELVREAVALCEARQRGHERLPHADELWLTRTGLEQATTWDVAVHKAKRFKDRSVMADLCCGIGIDTAALSKSTSV